MNFQPLTIISLLLLSLFIYEYSSSNRESVNDNTTTISTQANDQDECLSQDCGKNGRSFNGISI